MRFSSILETHLFLFVYFHDYLYILFHLCANQTICIPVYGVIPQAREYIYFFLLENYRTHILPISLYLLSPVLLFAILLISLYIPIHAAFGDRHYLMLR